MTIRLMLAALIVLVAGAAHSQTRTVWMETSYGPMILELDEAAAPITVENFLAYVEDGFYDGQIFHRVFEEFVIQTGTFDEQLNVREPTRSAIASERNNGLPNQFGTIAMALAGNPPDVNSAQAAFYINTAANDFLDEDFTVFGEVVAGLDVLDRIRSARLGNFSGLANFPARPARIERMFEFEGYPIVPLHTGSWRDPENPGRGLNIEIANPAQTGADAILVVYLYDFFEQEQIWLVGSQTFDFGVSSVTIPMLILEGPQFGDAFDPEDRIIEEWGTITLEITGCGTATMTYDSPLPGYGSGERPLTRLTRPNDLDNCDDL